MIILNTEKGIVRIEKWQDVLDRPAYRPKIDPTQAKLKTILGSYYLDHEVHCGLPCNQPHNKGYLVETDKGIETNIGNKCGKNHFSVNFEEMRVRFDRDVKRKTNSETIQTFQFRLPAMREQLQQLKEDPRGANWAYRLSRPLVDPVKGLERELVKRLGEMIKRGSADVVITRRANAQEQAFAESEAGRKLPPRYVEEKVATIAGLGFFSPDLDLRKLIVEDIEPTFERIAALDVQTGKDRQLAEAAVWIGRYEDKVSTIRLALELAKKLLRRQNLASLSYFVSSEAGRKSWNAYIKQLPDE